MDDGATTSSREEEFCTLLAVRADGVAPVVDLTPWSEMPQVRRQAERLLREHQSCEAVEVWLHGALVERIARP